MRRATPLAPPFGLSLYPDFHCVNRMPSLVTEAGQAGHAIARAEQGCTISREEALLCFQSED